MDSQLSVRESGGDSLRESSLEPCDFLRAMLPSPVSILELNRPGRFESELSSEDGNCAVLPDISDVCVFDLGSKAWVGLDDRLLVVSTETGPEISLVSILSLEGGLLLLLRRSTVMNPVSGFDFLTSALISPFT